MKFSISTWTKTLNHVKGPWIRGTTCGPSPSLRRGEGTSSSHSVQGAAGEPLGAASPPACGVNRTEVKRPHTPGTPGSTPTTCHVRNPRPRARLRAGSLRVPRHLQGPAAVSCPSPKPFSFSTRNPHRHAVFSRLRFIMLHGYCVFYELKVCGNPAYQVIISIFLAVKYFLIKVCTLFFKTQQCRTLNRLQYRANITSVCTGKAKTPGDSLYCDIPLAPVVRDRTHIISKVCLYFLSGATWVLWALHKTQHWSALPFPLPTSEHLKGRTTSRFFTILLSTYTMLPYF